MNKTLIVNRELCAQLLSVQNCIPAMRDTLIAAAGPARKDIAERRISSDVEHI